MLLSFMVEFIKSFMQNFTTTANAAEDGTAKEAAVEAEMRQKTSRVSECQAYRTREQWGDKRKSWYIIILLLSSCCNNRSNNNNAKI